MSRGSTPRHAQMAGDLVSAVQFNAENPWHFAPISPQSKNRIFIPSERTNVIKLAIAGYLRLPRPITCFIMITRSGTRALNGIILVTGEL